MGVITWGFYNDGGALLFEVESGADFTLECGQGYIISPIYTSSHTGGTGPLSYFYFNPIFTVNSPYGNTICCNAQQLHHRYNFGQRPLGIPVPICPCAGPNPPCPYLEGNDVWFCSVELKHATSGGTVFDTASGSLSISRDAACCDEEPPPPDEPSISSVSEGTGTNNPLTDTAYITNFDDPTGTITFNLYGPDDVGCAGSIVFTDTLPVNGNGAYTCGPYLPTAQGVYRWVVSYSGDGNNSSFATGCGDSDEETNVGEGVNPGMSRRAASTGDIIWFRPEDRGQVF